MKVLSVTQPFALLIANGTKRIETRSWKTNYRGRLYIHASSTKIPKEYKENTALMNLIGGDAIEYGKILCSCNIVDCIKMTEDYVEHVRTSNPTEYDAGMYAPGRYAWILEDIQVLENPIVTKGHLGLWNI